MGAVLLVAAVAGYGLLLVDDRLGTLHLSHGEIEALRNPASGEAASGARFTATRSTPSPEGDTSDTEEAGAHNASKDLPISAPVDTPSEPAAFNRIAPPAYLANVASPAPAPTASLAASPASSLDVSATDRRYVVRRILPIDGPIRYGEWHWDEAGVPPGPLVITVDLDARVISAFRNGYEIGTAAALLGTGKYPTPTGVFPVSQKDAHHISNIYDAPMPYMLRLTRDGVTIHGSNVRNGFASHGCIGVPMGFAKLLFEHVHLGDRVYITRGKQVGLGDTLVDR